MIAWIDQYHSVVWSEKDGPFEDWWYKQAIWDDMLIDGMDDIEFDGGWMILT